MPPRVTITGLDGIPEVQPGADLAALILEGVAASGEALQDGDLLVVTHKIVSKAEGQLIDLRTIAPSDLALRHAEKWGKDARQIEVVLREAARIVRMERGLIIAETRHGFICANAAVDNSNVQPDFVCLLPEDADASAARIRDGCAGDRLGFVRAALAVWDRECGDRGVGAESAGGLSRAAGYVRADDARLDPGGGG
jgi:coenzyme F420-0:L-glutamate ligase / coenzyme F420-1:gamma-L-glutamate ligase